VIREYVGGGEKGQAAAAADAERRREEAAAKKSLREQQAQLDAADGQLAALSRTCDLMMRATLMAAGLHQHDRGLWRRRRQ
jgi:transcription elongation GreA/GreB family factor